jgi:2'-5' RNA ligase
MRTFVAVEVGQAARETLGRLLEDLRARVPGVRWSKPGNVHVTLRFLGEIEDAAIADVAAAARDAARDTTPFSLRLGPPASFGGRSPRVLLLGVEGEIDALARLQSRLEDALETRGFGREARAFKPHLTLGRRKKGTVPAAWCDATPADVTEWEVEELVVFSSTLTPAGPIYTALARCPLEGEERPAAEPKKEP